MNKLPAGYKLGAKKAKAFQAVSDLDRDWYPDGMTQGDTVFDDGSWSEDQPTGILTNDGEMIYRCRSRIGFDLGFDE